MLEGAFLHRLAHSHVTSLSYTLVRAGMLEEPSLFSPKPFAVQNLCIVGNPSPASGRWRSRAFAMGASPDAGVTYTRDRTF